MKIITNDAVYVQKNDMIFLSQIEPLIPVSIFMKVFGNGVTVIDNSNRYEFIKFEEQSEINFFRSLDWIVDYNEVKDLDESQFKELVKNTVKLTKSIAKEYNSMTYDERMKNIQMVVNCEKYDFKICTLRDILAFKNGRVHFDLPEGVDYPTGYNKVKEKGLTRVLSRFKKNK